MATGPLQKELERTGRILSRWQAELRAGLWAAIVLGSLWVLGLSDLFIQFGRLGRVLAWGILVILIGAAFRHILAALSRKHTVQGIAAAVEKSFPELDNHVINYVQFSASRGKNQFKEAYLRHGIPEWKTINIKEMKDRKAHRKGRLILAGLIALLVVPCGLRGRTWAVALWRIANPFSDVEPVSLTKIVGVEPGNATVLQGNPLVMLCRVRGHKGHRVRLDIRPSDDKTTSYNLGTITGSGVERFSYRVAEITADMKYRFRAGDDPSLKWFDVKSRPPPAFTRINLRVNPPGYTEILPRNFDGMSDEVEIPQGSDVGISVECNSALTSASVGVEGLGPVSLTGTADKEVWQGTVTVAEGKTIRIEAENTYGERIESSFDFRLVKDAAPTIRMLAPRGRTVLEPGTEPDIEFVVSDDYGLAGVTVERIAPGTTSQSPGETLKEWSTGGAREFTQRWRGSARRSGTGEPLAFRVVARDNCPFSEHVGMSPAIIFNPISAKESGDKRTQARAEVSSTLSRLIDLQRANLRTTRKLRDATGSAGMDKPAAATAPGQWEETAAQQKNIRQLAGTLLGNPLRPLGGMTPAVRKLYMEEMLEVIMKLGRVPAAKDDEKLRLADKSISLEETILRKLTYADIAADKVRRQRRISGLLAMLASLIKGETDVVADTTQCMKKAVRVGAPLVDRQDELASDVTEFVNACRREAPSLEHSDRVFSGLIEKVAGKCEEAQVKREMLKAAEKLEENIPHQAIAYEKSALATLEALKRMLNRWQLSNAEERIEEVVEALHDAKERMQKLRKLQEKMIEAMRLTELQKDRSGEERDLMEEDIEELKKNMKEAMLEIPRDLHIFPELSVANELVEDVCSIFEEVEQIEGTEVVGENGTSPQEIGVLKPDELIEAMKSADERLDDVETWLSDTPESEEYKMEAFDREEMPKMALGALPATAEDLIGDLLKESEEIAKKTEDTATNLGLPDDSFGWDTKEGPLESFGAKGKSGNQTPDHKEQSGRSNVGRQGQAIGETAAGSGTITEGDKNIEKRITPEPLQSGQVQADGEADENATGGGKQSSGAADEVGMAGAGTNRRVDSTAQGSMEGLEALMAKTQAIHVKASLLNLRTESLGAAAHHMHQASDAIAAGLPISQVREHQKRVIAALRRARTELSAGAAGSIGDDGIRTTVLEDVVEGGTDNAPANYRELVAEYFRSLSESI